MSVGEIIFSKYTIFATVIICVFASPYIYNLLLFGSSVPIGVVHSAYSPESSVDLPSKLLSVITYFVHFYVPFFDNFFGAHFVDKYFSFNEISLFVSVCLVAVSVGIVLNAVTRREWKSVYTAFLAVFILTLILTVFIFVPKNRMFYWFTPVALLSVGNVFKYVASKRYFLPSPRFFCWLLCQRILVNRYRQ